MNAWAAVFDVGVVMFVGDDDESEIAQWGEWAEFGGDDDPDFIVRNFFPDLCTFFFCLFSVKSFGWRDFF